jgi:hypothetical protein
MPSLNDYLSLITSEHSNKPDFVATVALNVQPFVDMQQTLASINGLFDVDVAVGEQLDATGQWIGRTRYIATPLNIFFSFDTPGLGFDQGVWYGPYEQSTGLVALPDYQYRILLKATIAANTWDGTIPGAYAAWNTLLNPFGYGILIQDYDDMSMAIALIGQKPDVVTEALFTTGELDLKPAGVSLVHVLPTVYPAGSVNGVVGTPYFGFDVQNENIAGWDTGAWGQFVDEE